MTRHYTCQSESSMVELRYLLGQKMFQRLPFLSPEINPTSCAACPPYACLWHPGRPRIYVCHIKELFESQTDSH